MDTTQPKLGRRRLLGWIVAAPALLAAGGRASAEAPPPMTVFRDPNCACCHYWVEHLEAHGFV